MHAFKEWVIPPVKTVEEKALLFQKTWEKDGLLILKEISEITGLSFKRNYIPVYVVSGNPRAYSNPIVIKSRLTESEFINELTHELVHCLFVDNKDSQFVRNADVLFDNDHIALFAVIESVLLGTIDEKIDVENFPGNSKYSDAMSYVKKVGHYHIIEECKRHHDNVQ